MPISSESTPNPTLTGPLLPLLEGLINHHLTQRPLRRTLNVPLLGELEVGAESVRLLPEGVDVTVGYRGGRTLPQGRHTLRLRVVRSTPEETELALEQAALGMLAKLGGEGLLGKILAGPLQKRLGEGVRMAGNNIVLVHGPLLERLTRRA